MLGALGALVMPYNLVRVWGCSVEAPLPLKRALPRRDDCCALLATWRLEWGRGRAAAITPAPAHHVGDIQTPPLPSPLLPSPQYFHSAVVGSRRPEPPTPGQLRGVLRYLRIETPVVLLGAFLINLTVICVFAQGFYGTGELSCLWGLRVRCVSSAWGPVYQVRVSCLWGLCVSCRLPRINRQVWPAGRPAHATGSRGSIGLNKRSPLPTRPLPC